MTKTLRTWNCQSSWIACQGQVESMGNSAGPATKLFMRVKDWVSTKTWLQSLWRWKINKKTYQHSTPKCVPKLCRLTSLKIWMTQVKLIMPGKDLIVASFELKDQKNFSNIQRQFIYSINQLRPFLTIGQQRYCRVMPVHIRTFPKK